jgi:phosphonate transport system substrate-binding protein
MTGEIFVPTVRILFAGIILVATSFGVSAQSLPPPKGTVATPGIGADQLSLSMPRSQLLILGKVSNHAGRAQKRLEALADWLVPRLRDQGIKRAIVRIASSIGEMRRFLKSGNVDFVSESILGALDMEDRAGGRILLNERREGNPSYSSVFITRRNSKIHSLADLVGKRVAFEDPGSTSSFLLPVALLRRAGHKVVRLDGPRDEVPVGMVGYVFTGGEINVAAWTERGLVDAGAYSIRDWRETKITPPRFRKELRVFLESKPILRAAIVVRADMRPDLARGIERALLSFATASDTARVRKKYYRVSGYDKLEGKTRAALEDARKIYAMVKDVLR